MENALKLIPSHPALHPLGLSIFLKTLKGVHSVLFPEKTTVKYDVERIRSPRKPVLGHALGLDGETKSFMRHRYFQALEARSVLAADCRPTFESRGLRFLSDARWRRFAMHRLQTPLAIRPVVIPSPFARASATGMEDELLTDFTGALRRMASPRNIECTCFCEVY